MLIRKTQIKKVKLTLAVTKNITLSSQGQNGSLRLDQKRPGHAVQVYGPEFLESKFRCSCPKGALHTTTEPLQHEFKDFFFDMEPDFDELFEDDTLFKGLPNPEPVAPTESESDITSDDGQQGSTRAIGFCHLRSWRN